MKTAAKESERTRHLIVITDNHFIFYSVLHMSTVTRIQVIISTYGNYSAENKDSILNSHYQIKAKRHYFIAFSFSANIQRIMN